jgi:Ca2+:H+ antiporter
MTAVKPSYEPVPPPPLPGQSKNASIGCCCWWPTDGKALKDLMLFPLNILLVFVPLGVASHHYQWTSAQVFIFNFLGIIPLAGIMGNATESLAEHTGPMVGGLINASFGNAVELIVTVLAIKAGLCSVVKATLIGSILSNLLLVLGMAFVASGLKRSQGDFNEQGAQASCASLLTAAIGVSLPTLFAGMPRVDVREQVGASRACAIILAGVYVFYLIFQLKTHKHFFEESEDKVKQRNSRGNEPLKQVLTEDPNSQSTTAPSGEAEDGDEDAAELSPFPSTIVLGLSTLIVSFLSDYLIDSIEDVSEHYHIPQSFIGLILLPIVGNAAEHLTAVTTAFKGKLDLSLGVAVGSSTQVALLIVPFAVIVGWVYDQPMSLNFGTFYSGVMVLSVFLVNQVLADGSCNWLEGLMLMATYTMIAVMCCYVPNDVREE